jgi:hypothetical protein
MSHFHSVAAVLGDFATGSKIGFECDNQGKDIEGIDEFLSPGLVWCGVFGVAPMITC